MKNNRWTLITCLTTLTIFCFAFAAVATPPVAEAPAFTKPKTDNLALDSLAPGSLQTPAFSPAAKSFDALTGTLSPALGCRVVCGPGGNATATASGTTCPKARNACFNKAANLVECSDGDVCNEGYVQESCTTKPNGKKRVTCRVAWDCTVELCP